MHQNTWFKFSRFLNFPVVVLVPKLWSVILFQCFLKSFCSWRMWCQPFCSLLLCAKRLRIPGVCVQPFDISSEGLDCFLSRCAFVYLLMFLKTGLLFEEFPVIIMPSQKTGVTDFFPLLSCVLPCQRHSEQYWPLMPCCTSADGKDKLLQSWCAKYMRNGGVRATQAFSLETPIYLLLTLLQAALETPWNEPSREKRLGKEIWSDSWKYLRCGGCWSIWERKEHGRMYTDGGGNCS